MMRKAVRTLLACAVSVALLLSCIGTMELAAFADTGSGGLSVRVSIAPFETITRQTAIEITYSASTGTLASCETKLENNVIGTAARVVYTPSELATGTYTLVMKATDTDGHVLYKSQSFRLADTAQTAYTQTASSLTVQDSGTVSVYAARPLAVSASYGATATGDVGEQNTFSDRSVYDLLYGAGGVQTTSSTGIPYQVFTVALDGRKSGQVALSYNGETAQGERIALKIYNPKTGAWDTLSTVIGSGTLSASVDVATYGKDDKLQVAAVLDYVANGSEQFMWITDPQHYTKFADLNEYYYRVYQYAAALYQSGDIGYVVNTGDLVDDRPYNSLAPAQWDVSSAAISIAEQAGLPVSVVTGNHDVDNYTLPDYSAGPNTNSDYSLFWEHYGAERFNNSAYYGGSMNNNASHYDLVTIGNVDFIFVSLGYGVEATDETIEWVNNVLQTYKNRNAILCTHAYILNATADWDPQSRAQLIYEKMVVPNENVQMVLCGHDDGTQLIKREPTPGRVVYEVLSDYQFVEYEDDSFYQNEHYIGAVPECCGDGYLRLMKVVGNTISSVTYSPITEKYNPYGNNEEYAVTLDLIQANRTLTTNRFSAAVAEQTPLTTKSVQAGETVTVAASGDWMACIQTASGTTYTAIAGGTAPAAPAAAFERSADATAFKRLLRSVGQTDLSGYTTETASALTAAIFAARQLNADTASSAAVTAAYRLLEQARGGLTAEKQTLDRYDYVPLYTYLMWRNKWQDSHTWRLLSNNTSQAYCTATPTENGGFTLTRAQQAIDDGVVWPSARYTEQLTLSPNGALYIDVNIVAESCWNLILNVRQDGREQEIYLNYCIDDMGRTDEHGFSGVYKGTYDVSRAFTDAGFDLTRSLTLVSTYIFCITGPITYDSIAWLTDPVKTADYSIPATPDHPYYAHAAAAGPAVDNKVDILSALGLQDGVTISTYTPSTMQSGGVTLDLEKTPYIYLSVLQPEDSSFTFTLQNNMADGAVPWMIFRDVTKGNPGMGIGAGSFNNGSNREQYVLGSETICIDLRDYLNDASQTTWTIENISLYNYVGKEATVCYFYAGSASTEWFPERPSRSETLVDSAALITQSGECGEYLYADGTLYMANHGQDAYTLTLDVNKTVDPSVFDKLLATLDASVGYNVTLNVTDPSGNVIPLSFGKELFDLFDLSAEPETLPVGRRTIKADFRNFFVWNGGVPAETTVKSIVLTLPAKGTLSVSMQLADSTVMASCEDAATLTGHTVSAASSTLTSAAYSIEDGIVSRVAVGTSVTKLLSGLSSPSLISAYTKGGVELFAADAVATGMTLALENSWGDELGYYTVSVVGDVDGNGTGDTRDVRRMLQSLAGGVGFSEAAALAADVDGDGSATTSDVRDLLVGIVSL